jgi:dihydrofolate synthase/folylpolyglutamate synthase
MKFGLKNIQTLLSALDNPHTKFPSVHIAGTNGKGSTAAMIAAVLTACGYRVGLYTSPHLVRFAERIRVDGKEIDEQEIIRYVGSLRKTIENTGATFFEATTAMAFQHFFERGVDFAVIETGLGGRLDATNVLQPILSIITTVGLDHTEILGDRIQNIAREKGGIIKADVPCLVGNVSSDAREVLRTLARRHNARLHFPFQGATVVARSYSLLGTKFDLNGPLFNFRNLTCSLAGKFQENNVVLALAAITLLKQRGLNRITEQKIRQGLSKVQEYSGLRGRFEVISSDPFVIVDVAHNPEAMRNLVDSIHIFSIHNVVTVIGVMVEKDLPGIVKELKRVSRVSIAVEPATKRAAKPYNISRVFHQMGSKCVIGGAVPNGVEIAYRESYKQEPILITGSHYVVGEFLQSFMGNKHY